MPYLSSFSNPAPDGVRELTSRSIEKIDASQVRPYEAVPVVEAQLAPLRGV